MVTGLLSEFAEQNKHIIDWAYATTPEGVVLLPEKYRHEGEYKEGDAFKENGKVYGVPSFTRHGSYNSCASCHCAFGGNLTTCPHCGGSGHIPGYKFTGDGRP